MPTRASSSADQRWLSDFHELLRVACEGHPASRPQSVLYQSCRAALMAGKLKPFLPGFVRQCASIERFREFIQLYHHDREPRIQFVDGALAESWANLGRAALERPAVQPPAHEAAPEPASGPVPVQVAPLPPAPVVDDDDGFMDDSDDSDDDRAQPALQRPTAPPDDDFLAEFVPGRLRGAH